MTTSNNRARYSKPRRYIILKSCFNHGENGPQSRNSVDPYPVWMAQARLSSMQTTDSIELKFIRTERELLQNALDQLIVEDIDYIPIGNRKVLPFGWRKAAKGRTVWRIAEEVVTQYLEKNKEKVGFESYSHAASEVGVYDFSFNFPGSATSFVNIKTAVKGQKTNKDDISKASRLVEHLESNPGSQFYIATFVIEFTNDPGFKFIDCTVMPLNWLPDIYVNPSNNGNVQSAKAKQLDSAVERTAIELIEDLHEAIDVANEKRRLKNQKPIG